MQALEALEIVRWQGPFSSEFVTRTADALESGKLLYAPALHFELSADERRFLSPDYLDGKAKNITYRPEAGILRGERCQGPDREKLTGLLRRYYRLGSDPLKALCPEYADHFRQCICRLRR